MVLLGQSGMVQLGVGSIVQLGLLHSKFLSGMGSVQLGYLHLHCTVV